MKRARQSEVSFNTTQLHFKDAGIGTRASDGILDMIGIVSESEALRAPPYTRVESKSVLIPVRDGVAIDPSALLAAFYGAARSYPEALILRRINGLPEVEVRAGKTVAAYEATPLDHALKRVPKDVAEKGRLLALSYAGVLASGKVAVKSWDATDGGAVVRALTDNLFLDTLELAATRMHDEEGRLPLIEVAPGEVVEVEAKI